MELRVFSKKGENMLLQNGEYFHYQIAYQILSEKETVHEFWMTVEKEEYDATPLGLEFSVVPSRNITPPKS